MTKKDNTILITSGLLVIVGVWWLSRKKTTDIVEENAKNNAEPPDVTEELVDAESYNPVQLVNANWTPSNNAYFAYFPGWRRAKAEEVTPEMRADAAASLKQPLRAVVDRPGYRIALETHFNETKGEHKGATIFFRATTVNA